MISTVTLNTAMDRTLLVPNFLVGRRHRASRSVIRPGGRGVVIARALKTLGAPVIATGLAGGLTGDNVIHLLTGEGILNDFVRIAEPSRTSTAVIDPLTGVYTEINENGPSVSAAEIDLLVEKLRYLARASRFVVLAGSLPRDVDPDIYQRLVRVMHGLDVRTVVDSPDDPATLRAALAAEPTLTVIRQREAENLVGHEFGGDDDFLAGLDEMGKMGGRDIIVTHELGAYARTRAGRAVSLHACRHDPIEATSPLGSTDVLCAAFVSTIESGKPVTERLAHAMGAALANRLKLGAGVFEKPDVPRMVREVRVEELEPVELELELERD